MTSSDDRLKHNELPIENAEEFMKRVGLGGGDYTKVEVI